jgi:hypothetical protein
MSLEQQPILLLIGDETKGRCLFTFVSVTSEAKGILARCGIFVSHCTVGVGISNRVRDDEMSRALSILARHEDVSRHYI